MWWVQCMYAGSYVISENSKWRIIIIRTACRQGKIQVMFISAQDVIMALSREMLRVWRTSCMYLTSTIVYSEGFWWWFVMIQAIIFVLCPSSNIKNTQRSNSPGDDTSLFQWTKQVGVPASHTWRQGQSLPLKRCVFHIGQWTQSKNHSVWICYSLSYRTSKHADQGRLDKIPPKSCT
jgi:hypothetical protein